MQVTEGKLLLSASDLINFLECEHLTFLDLEHAQGRFEGAPKRPDTAELVARKGTEHEQRYLESLRALHGDEFVEVDTRRGYRGVADAAERTRDAMAAGAPVIYQATFLDGGWVGHADFLERVDYPSELGTWSYEVTDTKLARAVKPYFVVQLCLYSELAARVQGALPQSAHVVLGTGERKSFRLADFAAYFRRMREHFQAALESSFTGTYPDPVPHCALCRWSDACDQRRIDDDHLSLVARMTRPQTSRLNKEGILTLAQLAEADGPDCPSRIGEATFDRLRQQARLQLHQRKTGELVCERLKPDLRDDGPPTGFARLPRPSEGDVFFDIEGDPFYEDGLEYLWGVVYLKDGSETFTGWWGRDRVEEKQAFEAFVDFVVERRARFPDMHVYHYAPYEPTAMKRLMGLHATREDEVDQLLRENVLVDLYRVVEQSVRISQPSYSLKKVEAFYMEPREASVTDGEDSILMFEKWLESREQSLLEDIQAYNAQDCRSTLRMRDWLLRQRALCEQQYEVEIPWRVRGPEPEPQPDIEASEEVIALQAELVEPISDDPADRSDEDQARWLLAQLLDYHRREAKPSWWEYFDRLDRSDNELIEADPEAIAGLTPVGPARPMPGRATSLTQTLTFPQQEHKIAPGTYVDPHSALNDPVSGELLPFTARTVTVLQVDDESGELHVKIGPSQVDNPLPTALIPGGPYRTADQQAALRALARAVLAGGAAGEGPHRAARDVLRRALPRTKAVAGGAALQGDESDLERIKEIVRGLDQSYLFIQGPPGSGKTYTGARLILDLIERGARVGVTSNSHKAINNLLHEVEAHASPCGVSFVGLKKSTQDDQRFVSELAEPLIFDSKRGADFPPPGDIQLVAGTAWLWCAEKMRERVDYLVIDEAGQISLADALAMGTTAHNLVLLGDPLQLAQVAQGTHPPGSGVSVLEHLLRDAGTIPRDRGIFLDQTRRMHPDVCRFISNAVYEGRLEAMADCELQRIDGDGPLSGTGVRWIPVAHTGNTRQSPEEAARIADEIAGLIGARYMGANGESRALRQEDLMIVTPYNAQVRCLYQALKARGAPDVPVGTVDKFQGQEAALVFFSMATSSGDDVPRNVEFLYSRNRLNVAVSRARCVGVLVANPDLLTIRCRTVEQMRLVNALCLLVETASQQTRSTLDVAPVPHGP